MNRIIVDRGVNKKLQGIFGMSRAAIYLCLKGTYEGRIVEDKARRIRKAAMENGGIEIVK